MSTTGRSGPGLPKPKPHIPVNTGYSPRLKNGRPFARSAPSKPLKTANTIKTFLSQLEQRFGRLTHIVGEGDSGCVYRVPYQEGFCALKVPRPERASSSSSLKQEYENSQLVAPHDNLIRYMALFQSDGESASCGVESMEIDLGHNSHSPCAVLMELAEGRSLQDRTLSEDELRRYVHDILQGLEHIHNYNCMHLDIKPANIFLSDETGGTAMIGDFGQLVSYDSYKPHCIQEGDKRYLAPELLGDVVPPIHAPDIFSLAVSILECATNLEIPQHGEAYQMLRSEQFPEAFMSTLSPSLQDMLRKMLRRDPEARPTAKELLNEPFFATLPPSLATTARRKKSRSTSSPSTPLMITSTPFSVASSAPAHHFMTAHPRPFGYYGAQPSSAHDDSAMAAPVCRRIDFGGS